MKKRNNWVKFGSLYVYKGEVEIVELEPGIYIPKLANQTLSFDKIDSSEKGEDLFRYEENYKSRGHRHIMFSEEEIEKIYQNRSNKSSSNYLIEDILALEEYSSDFRQVRLRVDSFLDKLENIDTSPSFKTDKILLMGGPGTGKTKFMERLSWELIRKHGAYVILIQNDSDLDKMIQGNGFSTISKELHGELVVYIIEEIENLVENSGENTIKTLLDSTTHQEKVIYFMTTNYPERLPAAITRPGRMDFKIKIDPKNFDPSYIYALYEIQMKKPFPEKYKESDWLKDAASRLVPAEFANFFKDAFFFDSDLQEMWIEYKNKMSNEQKNFKRNGITGF